MAQQDSTEPSRRRQRVVMNRKAGWPPVIEPTTEDMERLADEAEADLKAQQEGQK